ncbi:MAG TPA: PaaI family thioesterase, partial [Actinomycetota bacterium]|nr:PaaI family thioesterase [Actinomycetota bacterium]
MSPPDRPDRDQLEVGLVKLLGLRFEEASADRVVLGCTVTPDLHQPFGLVHGGVYATMAETAASVAGALWLGDQGKVVGVSNHTDFL